MTRGEGEEGNVIVIGLPAEILAWLVASIGAFSQSARGSCNSVWSQSTRRNYNLRLVPEH